MLYLFTILFLSATTFWLDPHELMVMSYTACGGRRSGLWDIRECSRTTMIQLAAQAITLPVIFSPNKSPVALNTNLLVCCFYCFSISIHLFCWLLFMQRVKFPSTSCGLEFLFVKPVVTWPEQCHHVPPGSGVVCQHALFISFNNHIDITFIDHCIIDKIRP